MGESRIHFWLHTLGKKLPIEAKKTLTMKVKEQGQGLSMNGKPILISFSKLLALLYIGLIYSMVGLYARGITS